MDATVDKLEAMFDKTEADLDYMSRKLDAEFANVNDGAGKKNPAELLQQVSEIKSEFANIVKEAKDIQEAQKEAMKFFQDEMLTMCSALSQLQTAAGTPGEKAEELGKLEPLLGVPSTSTPPVALGGVGFHTPSPTLSAQSHLQEEQPEETVRASEKRRVSPEELVEVEEEEFLSVSSLVRGRVKLPEVNQTYRQLWTHFKEEGNTEPLSSSQMYKMGMRVSGQTGEAKLKVLQALKLLKILKNGSVHLI